MNPSEPGAVHARELSLGYGGEPVLDRVTFSAPRGTTVSVLGPNGGGKTTLLRALVGELSPITGSLATRGRPAYVAQTEHTRLDFPVSALDVALMGSLASGRWWLPATGTDQRAAKEALGRVGLGAETATRFGELSGGQRQRVLIARALVQNAEVLLLDEPLAGVDHTSAEHIETLFAELRSEGRTLLVSTHDLSSARRYDLVLCLNRRQVAFGAPGETLGRETLEQTYGSEIVMLDDPGQPARAIAVGHHHH